MPNAIRPWQHVLEPTFGYLILAQKQYSNFRFVNDGVGILDQIVKTLKKCLKFLCFLRKS